MLTLDRSLVFASLFVDGLTLLPFLVPAFRLVLCLLLHVVFHFALFLHAVVTFLFGNIGVFLGAFVNVLDGTVVLVFYVRF